MPRVALCQMLVGRDKAANVAKAVAMIRGAAMGSTLPWAAAGYVPSRPADVVVLPECFNCPYGTQHFAAYAEPVPLVGQRAQPGSTIAEIAAVASENKIWVVAGSIPERDESGRLFNTSATIDPHGVVRGVHRKIHLFSIDTPELRVDEASVLTGGVNPTIVDATADLGLKMGIGVCFDIRFPRLCEHYCTKGTNVLVFPSAFSTWTGPRHWHVAARSRAIDCQQYVIMCSIARDDSSDYVAYGHSLVVDPLGAVIAEVSGGQEAVVFADLSLAEVTAARSRLPILAGQRTALYNTWS
jgi:predicted amidohydrolase